MQKYAISCMCLGILLGVATQAFIKPSLFLIGLCIVIALAFLCLAAVGTSRLSYALIFSIMIGLCAGNIRMFMAEEAETLELQKYYTKSIVLEGTVSEYPDERSQYTYLTLNQVKVEGVDYAEKVLIRAPLYPKYIYGDKLQVKGKIDRPKSKFSTSSQERFSYSGYLSVNNIFSTITFPIIEKVSDAPISFIGILYSFKNKCISVATHYIAEPAAGLLVGILFGVKRALSSEVMQDFVTTGLVHIVVLSGYNIALVVSAVTKLFKRTPTFLKYLLIYSSIGMFILFVGASPTVVRAGLMATIALFARQSGREALGLQLLLLAGAIMVLYEPRILIYDPSFQLSFLATLGLVIWTPYAAIWCRRVPERFLLREITASTIATQMTVVPYILWYMGSVSMIGLFTNIIIVPFVPFIMLGGFITLVLGLLYLPLSLPSAFLTYMAVSFVVYMAHIFALVPGALLQANMPTYGLVIIYVLQVFYLSLGAIGLKR